MVKEQEEAQNEEKQEDSAIVTDVKVIKKSVEEGIAIVGTKQVLEGIRQGGVSTVYLTVNCPEEVVASVKSYKQTSSFKIINLSQNNDELGVICKKPFSISVLAIKA